MILWHQKLGHLNFKNLTKIVNTGVVREIPLLSKKEPRVRGPCQIDKQVKLSYNLLQQTTATKVLELLHMDLIGPMQVESIVGKRYVFVCVDDFFRFNWIDFLKEKLETFNVFKKLCKKLKNEKDVNIEKIIRIKSDHGKEFDNGIFAEYCDKYGIAYEFFTPKTPQ